MAKIKFQKFEDVNYRKFDELGDKLEKLFESATTKLGLHVVLGLEGKNDHCLLDCLFSDTLVLANKIEEKVDKDGKDRIEKARKGIKELRLKYVSGTKEAGMKLLIKIYDSLDNLLDESMKVVQDA